FALTGLGGHDGDDVDHGALPPPGKPQFNRGKRCPPEASAPPKRLSVFASAFASCRSDAGSLTVAPRCRNSGQAGKPPSSAGPVEEERKNALHVRLIERRIACADLAAGCWAGLSEQAHPGRRTGRRRRVA